MSFHCQQHVVDAMRKSCFYRHEICCLLLMARRADNETYRTRVSVKSLMYELQRSDKTVRRYIEAWESRGVIKKLVQGGNGKASLYVFDIEKLLEWADLRSQRLDRRYSHASTSDRMITGQNPVDHRSQRSDRQSEFRSIRSNGFDKHDQGERSESPKSIAEVLRAALGTTDPS